MCINEIIGRNNVKYVLVKNSWDRDQFRDVKGNKRAISRDCLS